MAWQMDLCMQWDKQVVIPFHKFVKPESDSQTAQSFPFFGLPVDLQLLVYDHCDTPTLFQLMRTCSRSRGPATRRFWSCADHWYSYDATEVLDDRRHVVLDHDLEFVNHVKRVEFAIDRLEWRFCDDDDGAVVDKAQDFWIRVGKIFPAIEYLVLCGYALEPSMCSAVGRAVQCAPNHITVFIALETVVVGPRFPTQYKLYSVPGNSNATWEIVDEHWAPTRVLFPPRKFPPSPLGDAITFNGRYFTLRLEARGLDWLRIESYARYAMDSNIHCPSIDCDAVFANREKWKEHLDDTSAGRHGRFQSQLKIARGTVEELLPYTRTPEAEKAAMAERQRHIDHSYEENSKLEQRVGRNWGPPGSEQRRLFEEQFVAQLKAENLWAPGTITGHLEDTWYGILGVSFDRTHVYGHSCDGPDENHVCYDA